jgi:hypothetical protein
LRPLIASMATLALNSGLWVRRLLNSFGEGYAYGGSPFQGPCPASEVNDGGCPEKADHPPAAAGLRPAASHRKVRLVISTVFITASRKASPTQRICCKGSPRPTKIGKTYL